MTAVSPAITDVALAAAEAAAGALPCDEPLTVAPATDAADALPGGAAVLAAFTGSFSGELVVVVEADLAESLRTSAAGGLDLAEALRETVKAAADALGPVMLSDLQQLDGRLALNRAGAHTDSTVLPLRGQTAVRALVALGIDKPAEAGTTPAAPVNRLDLLRGVEMDATVELGRARMTVEELLTLRAGSVIELDRAAGAAADLYVNGRLIAHGEVVIVDENYGLRITSVVSEDGK